MNLNGQNLGFHPQNPTAPDFQDDSLNDKAKNQPERCVENLFSGYLACKQERNCRFRLHAVFRLSQKYCCFFYELILFALI